MCVCFFFVLGGVNSNNFQTPKRQREPGNPSDHGNRQDKKTRGNSRGQLLSPCSEPPNLIEITESEQSIKVQGVELDVFVQRDGKLKIERLERVNDRSKKHQQASKKLTDRIENIEKKLKRSSEAKTRLKKECEDIDARLMSGEIDPNRANPDLSSCTTRCQR